MTVLLYVKKRTNRLERFVLYTNLIISNFITCIYRKFINYSKFRKRNYQACFFYEDLANSKIFLLWHARWERRLPPLPKNWLDPPCLPMPPPPPSICSEMFLAILMRKPFPTADLCLKSLDFLHFQIISNYNISLRSF